MRAGLDSATAWYIYRQLFEMGLARLNESKVIDVALSGLQRTTLQRQ